MKTYQVVTQGQPLEQRSYDTPEPTGHEILVKTVCCGVCHSDVHLQDGYFDLGAGNKLPLPLAEPLTLGHEIFGEVVAVGRSVKGIKKGQKYVVYPWIGCGQCHLCTEDDKEQFCMTPANLGIQRSGGFGDHVLVPHERYLFDAGDTPDYLAGSYACRGLTAYSALKKVAPFRNDNSLVIISAGGLGLLALRIARAAYGINPIVVDIDDAKLEVAKASGASAVINSKEANAAAKLAELTEGGAESVVDFVGAEASFNFGYNLLRRGGSYVLVGLMGGQMTLPLPLLTLQARKLMGVYVGSLGEMAELMQLVREGKIEEVPVEIRPISYADQTLEDLRKGKVLGVVTLQH
ncbi:MAG: alcohol dehydrogenase [Gammaproteobacteria bacterium]